MFSAAPAAAQPLGTFRWQLAPFCNLVTLAVTQNTGVFEMEGTDDQCGASGIRASAIGTAFINPDGSVGMGVSIISTPGGTPVHVEATINVATLDGTWRDSAGNAGSFVFTPGAGTGGSPRPAPTRGISPGSVGSVHVNPSQVQLRIGGSCASGTFMQSVGQTGFASCASEVGDISSLTAGLGLSGGGSSGAVTLSLPTTDNGGFLLDNNGGFVATGVNSNGRIPWTGPGTRMMWYSGKAAFRAGEVDGLHWDDANVGRESVAFGLNALAKGRYSAAFGFATQALGSGSVAAGSISIADGRNALAMGDSTYAGGESSVALGYRAITIDAADGSFVFADRSSNDTFGSLGPNEFHVRAEGGFQFYTRADLSTGARLPKNESQWLQTSDVNAKEHFRDLDGQTLLERLTRMPIREWSYKAQGPSIRHIGPTAQDFHAAFGLGADPLRIGTLDEAGVALAVTKALEARTRVENEMLKAELAELRARLTRLEAQLVRN